MRRLSFLILLMLCLMLLISCGDDQDKNYITFGEAGVLSAQIETTEQGSMRIPSPAGTNAAFCVGWKAEAEGETVFLPVGATYTYKAGESKSFTPVYFHFTTEAEVSLMLTEAASGICFATKVNKAEWNTLAALSAEVTRGALVLPVAQAQAIGEISHEALSSLSLPPQFVDSITDAWSLEEEDHFVFSTALTDIPKENYTTSYTAIGYIKITYSDGSERYAYANYGEGGAPAAAFYSFSEAVRKYLAFTMDAPQLELVEHNGSIRFVSSISKDQWDALVNTSVGTVTRGTLILSASEVAEIGGTLTHAALQKAGKTAIDIPCATWLTNTATSLLFEGTLTDIPEFLRSTAYTAVGYIKITNVDNSVTYIYADHENNVTPSASVMSLANAALLDLSETQEGAYQYAVGEKFSPYNEEEQAKLTALSKYPVLLVFDNSVKGNRRLHDDYFALYTERMIRFGDDSNVSNNSASSEEAREIYQTLYDTIYIGGGALIITAKDGTQLNAENIGKILVDYGTNIIEISTYIFYNGSLVVPYKVYTRPY